MSWSMEHGFEGDVLVVVYHGDFSNPKDAEASAETTYALLKEHVPPKVLFDTREVTARLGVGATFFHVRKGTQPPARRRAAILARADDRQYLEFYRATAANAGKPLKVFLDRDEALAWLNE